MHTEYSRWTPLGYGTTYERRFYIGMLLVAIVWSFIYFGRFIEARDSLYIWYGDTLVLREGAVMPDYYTLLDYAFVGFVVLVAGLIGFIVARYSYHHRGAKPVYLMQRLPDRWALHRRCLAGPLLGIGVGLAAVLALLIIYYRHYLATSPAGTLTPNQWMKLWGIGR